MDSKTDDRDPEIPSVGTAQDLEEALKWLEELTARQGKSANLPNPVPAASLDSPFHGLIDNDEGDLPDWLREAPIAPNIEGHVEGEMESRLDWLAKMAQRESIEELPTLEWRRLSEPVQSSMLPTGHESLIELPGAEEIEDLEISAETWERVDEASQFVEPEPVEALPVIESPAADEPDIVSDEATVVMADGDEVVTDEALVEFAVSEMEPQPIEEILDPFEIEPDEELPPIDDLDAAMAWIEELAASQDAPIEDVPSVADRALASKLMIEAGLMPDVSPLNELGSDSDLMEGRTPTHPFIEEEDFADTVILVETMAADQGMTARGAALGALGMSVMDDAMIEDTSPLPQEVDPVVLGEITPFEDPVEALSFEEAMAFLDEMAVEQAPELEAAETAVPFDEVSDHGTAGVAEAKMEEAVGLDFEPIDDAPLPAEEAPWVDTPIVAATVVHAIAADESSHEKEPAPMEIEQDALVAAELAAGLTADEVDGHMNGQGPGALETALLALDALALPTGKTLDDIDVSLRTAHIAPLRDVPAALAWLEAALAPKPVTQTPLRELDEEDLIAQMPEDPDEVLAWLERMADQETTTDAAVPPATSVALEETSPVIAAVDAATAGPLVEELAEADLLNMPEDPDEAMAWLEGLARGGEPAATQPAEQFIPSEESVTAELAADDLLPTVLTEETIIKPMKPRRKKPAQKEEAKAPQEPESSPSPTLAKDEPGAAWVDLLKPLD